MSAVRFGSRYASECVLIALCLVTYVVVWPVGEYAILDDWAFIKSLQHLQDEGRVVVLDWNPMTLIGHLVWGWIFTVTLGFSFFNARLATMCAGMFLVLLLNWFAKRHGADKRVALIASVSLFLNPLFLLHATMYMTDVTALFWTWLSIVCMSVGVARTDRLQGPALCLSSIFWSLAILTRQHGLAIPFAIAIYSLFFDRRLLRPKYVVPLFLPGIVLTVSILMALGAEPRENQSLQSSTQAVFGFLWNPPWEALPFIGYTYLVYAGLFLAPVTLSICWKSLRFRQIPLWMVSLVSWCGLTTWLHACMNGWTFPLCRNVVTQFGFFSPFEFAMWSGPRMWGNNWGMIIQLVGIVSVIALACCFASYGSAVAAEDSFVIRRRFAIRLLALVLALQFGYCCATAPILFDRHLLLLAPTSLCLAALLLPIGHFINWVPTSVLLGTYATYSIICTHDVHSVSRAVFLEGARLHESGIPLHAIDAGYAFDGWYSYEAAQRLRPAAPIVSGPWWPTATRRPSPDVRQPWWIYQIVNGVEPDFVVTAEVEVPSYMFQGKYRYDELECSRTFVTYWPWKVHRVRIFQCVRNDSHS